MKAFVLDVQEVDIKETEEEESLLKELEGRKVTFIHLCRLG